MKSLLRVVINGHIEFEYDRNTRLPGKLRQMLDVMDKDMACGIKLGAEHVASPDRLQKGYYVAKNLVQGLINKDQGLVSITSAYLSNRLADLNLIEVTEQDDQFTMELILDNEA